MQLEQTGEFEKDIKKLDKPIKKRLKESIEKISENPKIGKSLKHLKSVFSVRIMNYRLIYQYKAEKILFICFKSRKGVYDYLKSIF